MNGDISYLDNQISRVTGGEIPAELQNSIAILLLSKHKCPVLAIIDGR